MCGKTFFFYPTCGASLEVAFINKRAFAYVREPTHTELLLGESVYAADIVVVDMLPM
jgi:hypothetical protein